MRYPVAIEPGTARTAFGVVVPDLPGCYSAGDTLDEAIANAEEAIAINVDPTVMDDQVERVNITLPRRVLRRLDAAATAAGESLEALRHLSLRGRAWEMPSADLANRLRARFPSVSIVASLEALR